MEMTKNVTFLTKIDQTVKNIMKDGKIDHFDIPEILLLITDLISIGDQKKVTQEQLQASIIGLYDYIMAHYKLFPDDDEQKEAFKRLFDMSVKLIMFQPNIKKTCKSLFPCLK
jgi:hypothetical protein